jgi:molybdopterin-guanine dinucleotide biosynthesis protein A
MLGVIFCGGQSLRMASDKGLLKTKDGTWVQIAADKVRSLKLPVVVSVNRSQVEAYSSLFPVEELVVDDDDLQMKGPLCGLLSVKLKYPDEDLLILACDMPLMETGILNELLTKSGTDVSADAIIYSNDGEPEPLCGIYRSGGLSHIIRLFRSHQLPKHSMKYILEKLRCDIIPIPQDKKECFRNFNTHSELNGL